MVDRTIVDSEAAYKEIAFCHSTFNAGRQSIYVQGVDEEGL